MAKSQNTGDSTEYKAAKDSTPFILLATVADTTWRMFVPAVGFTLLGVWLDSQFGTKPWLMFMGITVGVLGAWMLVKKQVDEVRGDKK